MSEFQCKKCGKSGPRLDKKPLGGKSGQEVLDHVCANCWHEWDDHQIKLINEYRLNLGIPQHHDMLSREMKLFLGLIKDDSYKPMEVSDEPTGGHHHH